MIRRIAWPLLLVAFVVSGVVAVLAPGNDAPRDNEARIARVAEQIRCPTCAGLSVGESNAPLARSARDEIERRVSVGESDEEIRTYFVSRYGQDALVEPSRDGISLTIWVLPLIASALAAVVVCSAIVRWRRNVGAMPIEAEDVDDVGSNAEKSIADQGSISEPEATSTSVRATHHKLNTKKWLAVGAFALVAVIAMAGAVGDRLADDGLTGSLPDDTEGMLRQAQEYTARGRGVDAVKTYDAVLKKDPQNVQALTYRGWLVRLAGLPNEGLTSIDKAIEYDPRYPDAHFFKGFILLRDRNLPDQAIPEFRAFLENDPPREMVALVEQALQEAEALVASSDAGNASQK